MQTMGYYSGLKRSELSSHEKSFHEGNLNERSRSENITYFIIANIQYSRRAMETIEISVVAKHVATEMNRQSTDNF